MSEDIDFRELMRQPEVRELFTQRSGAHQDLGIELLTPDGELAEMRVRFRPDLARSHENPSLHAGAVMTAMDSAMGMATMLSLSEASSLATLELRYDELREPALRSDVFVSAECDSIDDGIAYLRATALDNSGAFAKSVARFILTPSSSGFFETALAAMAGRENQREP